MAGGFLDDWERPPEGSLGAPGPRWSGTGQPREAPALRAGVDRPAEVDDVPPAPVGPVTSSPAGPALPLAGFGIRLAARLIDELTIWAGLIVLGLLIGGPALVGDPGDPDVQAAQERFTVLGWLGQVAYWWVWNALGWSPGKRVVGLRIVTLEGATPGAGRGFARTVGAVLSTIPLFLGYFWVLWDPRRQAWHDRIAGTYVVHHERTPEG